MVALRVGVDAWNLVGDRRGIGRYVREVVRRWACWGPARVQPVLLIPESLPMLARNRYVRELGVRLPVRSRRAHQGLDDVWYPWNGESWVTKLPIVATLHDASLFHLPPDDVDVREREQRPFVQAASLARRIITDSQFSRSELVKYLGLEPERIDVIPLGVLEIFHHGAADRGEAASRLLFVGGPEPRKGLDTLFAALARLESGLRESLEIVLVGDKRADATVAVPAGVTVRVTGWIEDGALAEFYRNSTALVYPSTYEGFGLPIVEAMACGTPVIAADIPSSREAGGDAALYVTPGDPSALANAIVRVLCEPELRVRMARAGSANVKNRTWDATAEETLHSLERCLQEG